MTVSLRIGLWLTTLVLTAGTATAAVVTRDVGQWDLVLFLVVLVLVVGADELAIEFKQLSLTGNYLGIVLGMALLGPAAAAVLGVVSNLIWLVRDRPRLAPAALTVSAYAIGPLLGALALHGVAVRLATAPTELLFAVPVLAGFAVMYVITYTIVLVNAHVVDGVPVWDRVRTVMVPLLPSEAAMVLLAAIIIYAEANFGVIALGMLVALFFLYLYLYRELITSQDRAEELERRGEQLASLQVGVLTAMLRTLSMRDKMTARHSAAVARYAREIARAYGCSDEELDLVHTAGLLHDIGKFILPDHILLADTRPDEDDWRLIRMHPFQGARVVHEVDGYGPVAEIILAHHERIDGHGYPRGLAGAEIPLFSRMVSIADTYDVMTSRDSYRNPVSSAEAIAELRRVSGTQLDAELVEVFIGVLESRDVAFRHGDDADFEAELAFERRVRAHAAPRPVVAQSAVLAA